LIIATHPATDDPPKVGQQRNGLVYELFISTVLAPAVTAKDLLDLYLHRGSFETVLADEDLEQDPDRWCSHTPCGQEFWQIISQWVWNLRLELGQTCSPTPLRTTAFASASEPAPTSGPASTNEAPSAIGPAPTSGPASTNEAPSAIGPAPTSGPTLANEPGYGSPQWARPSFTGGFPGSAFLPQADGTLLCPAGSVLTLVERRPAPSKPGGEVGCIGLFHPTRFLSWNPNPGLLIPPPVPQFFGVIGLAAKSGVSG